VKLLRGFYRANRYEIRYLPGADGTGADEVADLLTALSKHIDADNGTRWLDGAVWDDGIVTGRGYLDIRLDFSKNVLGEVRERVLDPFAVYPDPEGDSYDPESWNHVHVARWASLDDIALLYGTGAASEVEGLQDGQMAVVNMEASGIVQDEVSPPRFFASWDPFEQQLGATEIGAAEAPVSDLVNRHRKLVRLIETQHRKLRKVRRFIDTGTGQIRVIPDHWATERIQAGLDWAASHGERLIADEAWIKSVRFTVTAANLVLHDEWSLYRSFTVVPFFPDFRRGHTDGMVSDLVDPQREINKRRSAMLQVLMTAPNSGWMVEEDSLTEESKTALETHGGAPGLILEYKQGAAAPQRIEVAGVPQGYMAAENLATGDLHEIAGINEAALGQLDKVVSGRAVEARQRSAYVGAEQYFDAFSRFQELKGRRRLELVQDFYTEARLFRVPNDAGEDQQLVINWQNAAGEIVNDISSGSYHCTVDSAPISPTFLQGAFEEAMELKGMGVPIPNDALIELSSIPLKRRILDGLQNQPAPPPDPNLIAAQAAMMRAQNEPQIAAMKAQADLGARRLDAASRAGIADKRVALEQQLETLAESGRGQDRALQAERLRLEQQGVAMRTIHAMTPGQNIPAQLQRNADAAFYDGNIGGSTAALKALDEITAPLPQGAAPHVSIAKLPGGGA